MAKSTGRFFGGIEGGGTKFICAVGSSPDDLRAEARFATAGPERTIQETIAFFQEQIGQIGPLAGMGLACFGPIDLNPESPTYGFITSTPKPGWANVDILGGISRGLGMPVAFDTDVNGAALGEWRWGAGQGVNSLIYLTVGTGIGGGALVEGRPVHGLVHPEMGHMLIPHDRDVDPFPGVCPFHADCLEGLATGLAMEKRWGKRAEELPLEHPAWELEAEYLAAGLVNLIMAYSPERIILGGGVMQQVQLFPLIREKVVSKLAGYVDSPAIRKEIDQYIVPAGLGKLAGVLGAIALADTR
ncbi:MAG: ROK family protein [Anaerolineaceae bacterium]|nr:ROK family protein [Anaerolineaceae bacterium]MBN2678048.1 ROK family protein [Anaerolineaceae bacterium]